VGGMEKLNQDFANWGLKQTKLNNWLIDIEGTNKTSPYDLVYLLGRIDRGELISKESKQWMMELLGKARVRTLIWPGLGPGAKLAHKSGDIGSMIGDAGIVTASDGTKYYMVMQVERGHNDMKANELIRNSSKLVYERFTNISDIASVKSSEVVRTSN
jgi:beta-lactamase class A